jgi:bacillithiol system protein YtxJ
MGFFSTKSDFPWVNLTSIDEFNQYFDDDKPFFVFKHSTRCSISSMALNRFEREYKDNKEITPLFLDLLKHRDVSNFIAEKTAVYHQSPQLILLKNKKVIYQASHEQINADKIVTSYEKL